MALKASPEDQARLLDLQAIDTRLQQLAHQAAGVPEHAVLVELNTRSREIDGRLATVSGALEDTRTELARAESDVAVVEARIARDTERVNATSSLKDVAGLETELASLHKRQFDLEEIELEVMERIQVLEEDQAREQAAKDEVAAERAEVESRLGGVMATVSSEQNHAKANRATIAEKLPQDLLALYERQRERYGAGASLLRGGVSGASGLKLNEHDMAIIRAAAPDDVLLCPDSNAILVRTAESGI
jgi:uncharacterized protein